MLQILTNKNVCVCLYFRQLLVHRIRSTNVVFEWIDHFHPDERNDLGEKIPNPQIRFKGVHRHVSMQEILDMAGNDKEVQVVATLLSMACVHNFLGTGIHQKPVLLGMTYNTPYIC